MLAEHQRGTRRGTDVVSGVLAGVAKTLSGHLIQLRHLDLLLAVAAKIVSENESDVGLALGK